MKIYTKVVIDIETGKTTHEESFDYDGEVALCKSKDQEITQRYAGYIERRHDAFLEAAQGFRLLLQGESPFADYEDVVIDPAFFGIGYLVSSFPSLYDMYGKFMAGLDVDALYAQIFEDTVNAPAINDLVSAESALLADDIAAREAAFEAGMVNVNSVIADSFVGGKVMIEDGRLKAIEKYSAELKYRMIPVATDRWRRHLDWNAQTVMTYAEMMKLYFSARMDVDDSNYSMAAKDKLWPFTVLEYERAALGALQGATTTKGVGGASTASKVLAGALGGAASGAMAGAAMGTGGGPPGMVIGAVIGAASGFL